MSYKHTFLKFPLVRFFSSIKLTVACLFLLYILTFTGTIAQIHEGLYLAQQHYFESFFFLAFGFLPFPGAQAVMWLLFINLIVVALTRFVYQWQRIGIIIIHSGLLLFLISGYLTLHNAEESHLTLSEGQASNVSISYHDWEVAIWENLIEEEKFKIDRDVTAINTQHIKPNQTIPLDELGFRVTVK